MQDLEEKMRKGIINKVRQEKLKTRKVGIKSEAMDYFAQRCLDPEDPKCNPDEFFKEISYIVDLNDIYKILGTCYYNDEMEYCPVQLEVKIDKIRQQLNNCKYLLQIWKTDSTKVYEQPLKNPLKNWAICFDFFLMVYDREDADNDLLHIRDIRNNVAMKVRGIGHQSDGTKYQTLHYIVAFLAYKNNKVFALTRNEIRFAVVNATSFYQSEVVEVPTADIRIVKPGCPLHGILMNAFSIDDNCLIVAFETPDNQLDFNMLYSYNDNDTSAFSYKWEQYRIVNPRKNHVIDPIKKMCSIFYQGFSFVVSMRESGHIDLYWNMARRDSPKNVVVQDIAMSIHAFYFKMDDGSYQWFKHEGKSNISFSMTERITEEEADWDNIYLRRIQSIVKLYTGFKIISKFETFFILAHGKYLSVFNIEQWKWINHLQFTEGEIAELLERFEYGTQYIDVILKNNQVYQNCLSDLERQEPFTGDVKDSTLEGDLLRVTIDKQNQENYCLVTSKNTNQLMSFRNSVLSEINFRSADTYTYNKNMVFVQAPKDSGEDYVIVQCSNYKLMLYQVTSRYSMSFKRVREFSSGLYIAGNIHSACSFDIKDHIFVFDQQNLYILRLDKNIEPITHSNLYAIGVQFFTKQVAYCLCQDVAQTRYAGLRLLDMESTLKKKNFRMMLLKNISFGIQGNFEYSKKTGRLVFQQSLSSIIISPLLHQNTNKLLGADENDSYILQKKIGDRLITFTQEGQLTTWNLVTGKHICTYSKTDLDIPSYTIMSKFGNVAIMCKQYETVDTMKDEQFFDPWQLQTYATNQATYMKRCTHDYRRWKIIEIKNESDVGSIMEFTFPYFHQGTSLYINEKRDRMILKIINFRTFLYKIIRPQGTATNEVTFELIRQIVDYPDELENSLTTHTLTYFSPCFSRYLKIDRKTKEFVIRDAIKDEIVSYVPKSYMWIKLDDPHSGDPKFIIHRFKWLDFSTFLIVNEEGVENILNIDDGYNEVAYNWRPLFNEIKDSEYLDYPYYYQRETLPESDVLKRLQRLYQSYKSDYYLFKKKSFQEFYEGMLSVDKYNPYYMEHSFTFLHWSLIDQILRKQIKIRDLEDAIIEQLLYNILPGGNTVLHLLCEREKELIRIFREAHQEDKIRFHVPFLPNIIGESPIHKCIEYSRYKSIDTILSFLKHYPSDHHSRAIKDKYGNFVKQNLPGFLDYIDSRFQQTDQIKKFNKACLKKDVEDLTTCELWFKEEDFYRQIVDTAQLETRIKCEFIDMPGVYHYLDADFQNFFDELAITEELDYFKTKAIQRMIDFNYPLVRTFILSFLFIPFCIFHVLFVVYSNAIYEHRWNSDEYERANLAVTIILLVFSAYFMSNEIRQFYREGIDYIISVWNYIDLIAPIGVIFTMILQLLDYKGYQIDDTMFRCVFSITTLFMWSKLLYFLRIFKSTGYLIRLLVEVVTDMGVFLLVLLITLTAFGDCLLRLSEANEYDNRFIMHSPGPEQEVDDAGNPYTPQTEYKDLFFFSIAYTYRMILGDFDTSAFGRVATPLVWIIWTIHMLFNMIVMLNLLISIIGDTYERVVDNSEQAGYQEFACLIAENQHLIPLYYKKKYSKQGKYLVQVTDLEKMKDDEDGDPVVTRLDALKQDIEAIQTSFHAQASHIEIMFKKMNKHYPEAAEEDPEPEENE